MPEYYRHTLANGKTVMETAPTIQWGYLIYLTVLRLCQYFGAKEECGFCDINHNWREHKQAGRPYTGIKPVEDVLEALAIIDEHDTERTSHAYTLTGGSVTTQGRRARGGGLLRPLRAGDRGALPRPLDRQGRRAGAPARGGPALPRLRDHDLPPELRGLGRASLPADLPGQGALRRPRGVAPADPRRGRGVRAAARDPELRRRDRAGADRSGSATVDEAIASTVEGLDFFMSRGVTPRFTTWCPEPATPLGRDNPEGAPLEYHVRLLEAYREALERHGLRPPPGTARPAPGNAVFSVSSFMDVLAPEAEGGSCVSAGSTSTRPRSSGSRPPTRN